MNWQRVAENLAESAVYGAIAQTRPPDLPKAVVHRLLELVSGHIEAIIQMNDFITRDSGERREFSTGSRRDSRSGKGRFDLIPAYCVRRVAAFCGAFARIPAMALRRLAGLYERGAIKYDDNNWRKGQPLSSTLDSMERHICDYKEGKTDEDHLSAVAWNAFTLMWTEEMIRQGKLPKELADLPDRPIAVAAEPAA